MKQLDLRTWEQSCQCTWYMCFCFNEPDMEVMVWLSSHIAKRSRDFLNDMVVDCGPFEIDAPVAARMGVWRYTLWLDGQKN